MLQNMTSSRSPHLPSVNTQQRLFKKHPTRSNTDWAGRWQVSREYVRRLRQQAGLPPYSQTRRQLAAERQARQKAEKQLAALELSDRTCAVCGSLVPVSRDLTCSSRCAEKYKSTFIYRVKR